MGCSSSNDDLLECNLLIYKCNFQCDKNSILNCLDFVSTWQRWKSSGQSLKSFHFRSNPEFFSRKSEASENGAYFFREKKILTAKFDPVFRPSVFSPKNRKIFPEINFFGWKFEPKLISCFRPDSLRRPVQGLLRSLVRKTLRNFRLRWLRRIL